MEEKKLTDEEIVKALEHCATENTCRGCVKYNLETTIDYFKCMRDTRKNVVDLFHRQKAEIERLMSKNKELTSIAEHQQHSNLERWGIIQEKDKEIKRLKKLCVDYRIDCDNMAIQRDKLQKQVDELKKPINGKFKDNNALQKAYECLEKEFTRRSQRLRELQGKETKEQVIECHGMLKGCDMVKQAVKNTAKEILTDIVEGFVFSYAAKNKDWQDGYDQAMTDYDNKLKEYFKERYGVEVE